MKKCSCKLKLSVQQKSNTLWILLKEMRIAILAAIMAGFGRVIAEVGAAMMVGGNILGETRILTTSIMMEVSKGNFDVAIALSFILMTIAFIITFCLTSLQQRRQYHKSKLFGLEDMEYECTRKKNSLHPRFPIIKGTTYGIMGPNGAGKSTLLKFCRC